MDEKAPNHEHDKRTENRVDGPDGGPAAPSAEPTGDTAPGEMPLDAEQTMSEEQRLLDQLEQERARAQDYLEQAQRARAELINYRRRVEQEMEQNRRQAGERVITRLLPVIDDFHRAVEAVPEDQRDNPWVQGVLMIERKLWAVLESEGVRPIEAIGKRFDPTLHEAVTVDEGVDTADTVVAEFQRGYTLHDRVLRPSMVKVGRGNGRSPDERSESEQS